MDSETLQRRRPITGLHDGTREKKLKRSEKRSVAPFLSRYSPRRNPLRNSSNQHVLKRITSLRSPHSAISTKTLNMEGPYGPEWQEEEKVKRKEMVAPEAHYIFVHEVANSGSDEMRVMSSPEGTSTSCLEDSGSLVGFVQYRFILEEEVPVLYVYELQLDPCVQGKGLGKFLMQLIELMAQKNCMGAVMLTVQKANSLAMNFYISKLRYIISTISPSKMGVEKSYEILCKTFTDEAKTILEVIENKSF